MSEIQYYIIDLETTGVGNQHEVVEISVIRCKDKVQITRFIKAEFPERASIDALNITKKTLEDLKQGSSKEEVVQEVEKFLDEDGVSASHRCVVAHNATFEQRFLHALWEKCGKTFPMDMFLDTMQLTRIAAKKMGIAKPKVNLEAACDLFNIKKTATFHSAKFDTRNTFYLWKKLTDEMGADYISNIKIIPHKTSSKETLDVNDLDLSDVI